MKKTIALLAALGMSVSLLGWLRFFRQLLCRFF